MKKHLLTSMSIAIVLTLALLAAAGTAAASPTAGPGHQRLPASPRIEKLPDADDIEADEEEGSSTTSSATDYVVYRGGYIQESPHIYIVYWGNWNSSNDIYGVGGRLYSLLRGVGGSPFASILTGYGYNCTVGTVGCPTGSVMFQNPTGQLRNWWYDTSYVPAQPGLADLQAEAQRAAAYFGDYDHNAQYVIALPRGHDDYRFTSVCAWHAWAPVSYGVGGVSYTSLNYMPDAGVGRCGNNSVRDILDGVSIVEGHEYAESVTNPFISYTGPSRAEGWDDSSYGSGEVGDKCMGVGGYRNSTFSTGVFPVQSLWSNYNLYYYGYGCIFR